MRALFQNFRRETGEIYFSVKLDFPVGATEILAFAPDAPEAREDVDGAVA